MEQAKEGYLGDLSKTDIIFNLINVPHENRDESWEDQLIDALPTASFRCGEPQVIAGPDGFPYFQVLMPEPNVGFQCFVIEKMKDDFLLENGFGVVLNPQDGRPDWVLTAGDILNYHLNGTFYSTVHEFAEHTHDEVVDQDEEVMVAQPSEFILPTSTRTLLKRLFEANGIAQPKVLLMLRKYADGMKHDIVFNVTENNFESRQAFSDFMNAVRWYLPRHYSFVGMEESVFGGAFMDL